MTFPARKDNSDRRTLSRLARLATPVWPVLPLLLFSGQNTTLAEGPGQKQTQTHTHMHARVCVSVSSPSVRTVLADSSVEKSNTHVHGHACTCVLLFCTVLAASPCLDCPRGQLFTELHTCTDIRARVCVNNIINFSRINKTEKTGDAITEFSDRTATRDKTAQNWQKRTHTCMCNVHVCVSVFLQNWPAPPCPDCPAGQ